jgi:hypothetical protein
MHCPASEHLSHLNQYHVVLGQKSASHLKAKKVNGNHDFAEERSKTSAKLHTTKKRDNIMYCSSDLSQSTNAMFIIHDALWYCITEILRERYTNDICEAN